ncbi:NADH pyrophosphatase [Pigmentiphaga sp. NML080357]|uniref:NAD(+) diphosphatase n=1 Tax=Pigmentiphaga sp. NML080357 TaxID=2008675 RepID=UPI000B41CC68|nr:NAD(+) diphosphatase [Pigmentiphaga sp. NML080357]OVZ55098.1 NADH pyrophosphatase [Pigmentiphaga sp. NML080357]
MHNFDRSAAVGFGFNPLDRLSESRGDLLFIQARRDDPATRFMIFLGDVPLLDVRGAQPCPLFPAEAWDGLGPARHEIFMGQDENGMALFAVSLDAALAETAGAQPGLELVDLRTIATRGLFPADVLGELGAAKAILSWHERHRHCANCGALSRMSSAGWRRDCDACGAQHFPRVDPVVIMLAVDGDRCLLGRQARFAPGMYSALAGFLEPGETIEDAVRREIREEAGVPCAEVTYFASQPWPFPASLMIGCFARACATTVVVDRNELEDARWFSREEVRLMLDGTHPDGLSTPKPFAIAYHLIRAFADDECRLDRP